MQIRIVNELTAAVIAYSLDRHGRTIVGGSIFDVQYSK